MICNGGKSGIKTSTHKRKHSIKRWNRTQKSVSQICQELGGNAVFRRAFRMNFSSFQSLYSTIRSDLLEVLRYKPYHHNCPNGKIRPSVRLAYALRYFSGGDPLDLITSFGISKTEVHQSTNQLV